MRPAVATAVLGLALAVAAPTTWALTRPEATAGAPVEQVLGPAGAVDAATAAPGRPPVVTARPAAPAAAGAAARAGAPGGARPRASTPPSTPWASSPTAR